MPFTFSHPAIVLPLTRYAGRYFSLTGLVVGSVAPDFEYFFRMKIQSNFSHTVAGVFYFNVPVAIFIAFVFHNLIRNSLIVNLPHFISGRLLQFSDFNWKEYFKNHYWIVLYSVLIGAFSHLCWDGFTHHHGFFVKHIPVLNQSFRIRGFEVPVYNIFQHLSTLIGGAGILFAIYRLPMMNKEKIPISKVYWLCVMIIVVVIIGIRFMFRVNGNIIGQLVATVINAIFVALAVVPFLMGKKQGDSGNSI